MAWPAEETPTSGGVWLECNGQTIDAKYARLRELVGDKTPDYQGVFLRGYGSMNSKVSFGWSANYFGSHTQTFSSASLNELQMDASRPLHASFSSLLSFDSRHYLDTAISHPINIPDWGLVGGDKTFPTNQSNLFHTIVNYPAGVFAGRESMEWDGDTWLLKRPPKKYSLEGDPKSGYNLIEEDDTESGRLYDAYIADWATWSEIALPTAEENRPINKAVRYFIKAR